MDAPRKVPILILDDDRDTGQLLVEMLVYLGIEAESVMSAETALALLEKKPYALLLADYLGGSVEGARSRAEELLRAAAPIPVAVMSGWRLPEELRARLAFTLLKPASAEQLLEAIGPYVSPQREQPKRRTQIDAYFRALGKKDWDELAALCHPQVVYHLPSRDPRFGRMVTGREAFKEFSAQVFTAFPEARFDVTSVTWLSYGAVVRYTGRWQGPSGADVEHGGVVLFGFGDRDLITSIGIRTDVASLDSLLK